MENHYQHRAANMHDLLRHASPSVYSCPDCGGALFQMHGQPVPRFRCHTGHAYGMATLLRQRSETVEQALWMTLRALQEKEQLAGQLAAEATADGDPAASARYLLEAAAARDDAQLLREMAGRAGAPLEPAVAAGDK